MARMYPPGFAVYITLGVKAMLIASAGTTATVVDPIEVQFHLAHDCIRACVYVEHIASVSSRSNTWVSIRDMCYSEAIISWNQIFGTDSQQAHWKKLSKALPIPANARLEPFGKAMVVRDLNISDGQWSQYHKDMLDFRNNRLAHFDCCIRHEHPPNLKWALQSACLYREWLRDLLLAYQAAGHHVGVSNTTGAQMLQVFRSEIATICR
ncbi:MAG: hypothetical protein ACOYBN_15570 [Limnohabitans sp.]